MKLFWLTFTAYSFAWDSLILIELKKHSCKDGWKFVFNYTTENIYVFFYINMKVNVYFVVFFIMYFFDYTRESVFVFTFSSIKNIILFFILLRNRRSRYYIEQRYFYRHFINFFIRTSFYFDYRVLERCSNKNSCTCYNTKYIFFYYVMMCFWLSL